jgi:hypothetical protein
LFDLDAVALDLEDRVRLLEGRLVRRLQLEHLHQVEQDRQVVHPPRRHVDLPRPFGDDLAGFRIELVMQPQLRLGDSFEVRVRAELVVLGDLFELDIGGRQPQIEARPVVEDDAALAAQHAVEEVAGQVGELELGRKVIAA